ncbi:hypothetical protein L596_012132 [Steinernema carpocapsae]|uniref:Uncharacterized protein n=1 Tax=Steinernema carpocapsae TaxID=34508 RepID=A0A4V6A4R0_STECR|nr:hypothetical protein L596_012132 [Steinernema carpocapsae]
MPNVSSVFPLILCFALAMTAAPDSANESCSLENLRTQLHFHSALIFIVTADCRLHVFRSWDAGTPLDVVKPETKLGNSPCGPDSKVIHFVYRRHQMPPILVVIVKFSTQEYSLLEIDLEHELNDQENATVPLKDRIGVNTTKQIHSPKPLSSCIFVDHQLICFWVDRDRKRVFQQKFHFDEKDLIYKGEDTPIAFDRTRRRSLDKNIVVSVWDQPSSPSVFLYDPHIAGWLYRISDQAFLARGQKRKYLHRIHSAEGELKSLTSMDKTVLLSTECYANEGCMYFMNFLQIKALAPHACVFHSRNPVIVGILTDVRHPLVPRSHERSHEKYTDLQQETQQFEALIVLASVVFASLAGFLGSAVVHESLKNEQKMEMENRMNALGRRFFKKPDEDVPREMCEFACVCTCCRLNDIYTRLR